MTIDNSTWELAEAYLAGSLPEAELVALQTRLQSDPIFAGQFHESVNLLRSVQGSIAQKNFRAMLHDIHTEQQTPVKFTTKIIRTIPLKAHFWRTASVAAGIAILTSLTTFWAVTHAVKRSASDYNIVRRELENIKRSQTELRKDINTTKAPTPPPSEVRYIGSGFAITNDGYFVTNYHVISDGDSVYIQNRDGGYFKTYLVAFDAEKDLAILKVEKKNFRFGKSEVPYTFEPGKAGLGEKVFTLGYPDDEIVYKEGYVSARDGYESNPMQYGLELHADHGQSGSPILDAQGNVLAILTAIGKPGEDNTYAVSSKALIQLIHDKLPKEVHLPKVNRLSHLSREQQIEKMEYYTCSVKVYKK